VTFRILLSDEAEKILDRMDRPTAERIRVRLRELEADPFEPRISKLLVKAGGKRSSRVGGWRIIFAADRAQKAVEVFSIRPRGEAYKRM
jgi:mRNA interferase RelE/StbE